MILWPKGKKELKVITLMAQKGGCGKTTLAINLSIAAVNEGCRTLLIDLDTQKTATQWWEAREATNPLLVHISYLELDKALTLAQEQEVELVLIDTAGRDDLMNTRAYIPHTLYPELEYKAT